MVAADTRERGLAVERDSYVDLLRAVAIGAVVLGHWLVTAVTYSNGHFNGIDVLTVLGWASWLTWPLQVIPLFFFVGGYVNALSWSRYSGADVKAWPAWVRLRLVRLLVPTSGYVAVMAIVVLACTAADVDKGDLDEAAWATALHLWFLAAYAIVVLLTPLLYAAHGRWGFAVPVVMAGAAAFVNLGTIAWHWHLVGWANYVLVWGAFHQLGFSWRDGALTARRGAALAAGAGMALVGLVGFGPYPVSMIGVPGARIQNASPPSIALLAFGVAQIGLALMAAPAGARWLGARESRRRATTAAAAFTMPIYLWHMVPVVVVAIVVYPTRAFPQPAIGSSAWWLQRIAWVALLVAVLAAVVWLVKTATSALRRARPPAAETSAGALNPAVLVVGVALSTIGLGRMAVFGLAPNGYLDPYSLVAFGIGLAMIRYPGLTSLAPIAVLRAIRPPSPPRRETARGLPRRRRGAARQVSRVRGPAGTRKT